MLHGSVFAIGIEEGNNTMSHKAFQPGEIVATKAVATEVSPIRLMQCLALHLSGDWGEVDPEDKRLNAQATHDGSRILSCYPIAPSMPAKGPNRIWLITEAEDDQGVRSHSTFLYPNEY